MKTQFTIVYQPGPHWLPGQPLHKQPLEPHRDHIARVHERGDVIVAGPFLDDPPGGIAILRCEDEAAARAFVAGDPAIQGGVLVGTVRQWLPLFAPPRAGVTEANLALVRRIFEAVEARGSEAKWAERWAMYQQAYDPAVVIREAPSLPYGGEYRGAADVARHALAFNAAWTDLQSDEERALEPQFFAAGDQVAVLWRQRAHNPWTGERFDMPVVSVYRMRAGRIVESRMLHYDAAATRGFLDRAQQSRANAALPADDPAAKLLARGRAVLAAQPFSVLLGAHLASFGAGGVEIHLPIHGRLLQQHQFVHGGVLSYLADNTLTFAGGLALQGGIVTSEMKINYIRPAIGTLLIARGQTISSGRTQAVTRCEIFAVEGGVEKLCAAAQGTIGVLASDGDRASEAVRAS